MVLLVDAAAERHILDLLGDALGHAFLEQGQMPDIHVARRTRHLLANARRDADDFGQHAQCALHPHRAKGHM